MIVAVISESQIKAAIRAVQSIQYDIGAIELRLDFFAHIDTEMLKLLLLQCHYPVIFTLRARHHGGHFDGDELSRLQLIRQLAALRPAYIDLEHDVSEDEILAIKNAYPEVRIIRSYHNFEKTPDDLDDMLEKMTHQDVDVYKIVTYAQDVIDCLNIAQFVQKSRGQNHLTSFCVGPFALFSRIIGAVVDNYFHYMMVSGVNIPAPNCPSLTEMFERYRFHQIDPQTKLCVAFDKNEYELNFHEERNAFIINIPLGDVHHHQLEALARGFPFIELMS